MTGSSKKPTRSPRVFLSYARADGEEFAKNLRIRLETEDIPVWQDRIGMEGGRDWWLQITDALDHVEFMTFPRFRRVREEKSGTLSEGGDHGQTTTKLYQRMQARGSTACRNK